MQSAKCKVQSEGVAFGDYLNKFAKQIHSFCILHSALCTLHCAFCTLHCALSIINCQFLLIKVYDQLGIAGNGLSGGGQLGSNGIAVATDQHLQSRFL